MKKNIFIALGLLLLLLSLGVWLYLFVYGVPESPKDIFGNFGNDNGNATFSPEKSAGDDNTPNPIANGVEALRQLTTRPVAGAVFLNEAIRYVERGTGHIYEIGLEGKETLVSNTTIPQTVRAVFSPDAMNVVLTAQRNEKNEIIIANIPTRAQSGSLDGISLPEGVSNIAWDAEGNGVYYFLQNLTGAAGYHYDLVQGKSTQLFEIPLRDVVVLWGDPTYVYTTPTARQNGYVYRLTENTLGYVTKGQRGLMAIPYNSGVVVTSSEDGVLRSSVPHLFQSLLLPLIPEKCVPVPGEEAALYCASTMERMVGEYPDDWYKGKSAYIDSLWKVYIETGENILMSDLMSESGREIDVTQIGTSPDGDYVYFINKNDGTLWGFDTTLI